MSKYIKLNAAIRILWGLDMPRCDYEGGVKQLESLPTIEISDSEDRPFEHFKGYEDGKASVEVSEDAISREELIKTFIREKSDYLMAWNDAPAGMVKETCDELDKCIATVINAPSVIPKPKEGEWIKSDIPCEEYVCSECGGACWYYDVGKTVSRSRCCPNCGAKMRLE